MPDLLFEKKHLSKLKNKEMDLDLRLKVEVERIQSKSSSSHSRISFLFEKIFFKKSVVGLI